MSEDAKRPVALVGLMGAGKSAVARALGERLGTAVADLDALLEAETGRSVGQLFEEHGEPWFRAREGELLREALDAGARVVACGGGLVLTPRHRALLGERCRVVWLQVTPAEAARRIGGDAALRPLLAGGDVPKRLERLLEERRPLYAEVADLTLPTDGADPEGLAERILSGLEHVA
jgi:shikimate kinase